VREDFKLYTVIEDDSVGQALSLAAIEHSSRLIERIFDAIVWRLARDPLCGTPFMDASGTQHRVLYPLSIKKAKNPSMIVRYTVDEKSDEVTIHRIVVMPYDPNHAHHASEYTL